MARGLVPNFTHGHWPGSVRPALTKHQPCAYPHLSQSHIILVEPITENWYYDIMIVGPSVNVPTLAGFVVVPGSRSSSLFLSVTVDILRLLFRI